MGFRISDEERKKDKNAFFLNESKTTQITKNKQYTLKKELVNIFAGLKSS